MWITTSNSNDPIEVSQAYQAGKVRLRIGRETPGKTRYANLTRRPEESLTPFLPPLRRLPTEQTEKRRRTTCGAGRKSRE